MIPENYTINEDERYIEFISLADNITIMRVPYSEIIIPDIDPIYESVVSGEWLQDDNGVFSRTDIKTDRAISDIRTDLLANIRNQCKASIVSIISIEHQIDLAIGLIPDLGYSDWISTMISESNRCEDLYDAADTINELKLVVCSFPEYTGGE